MKPTRRGFLSAALMAPIAAAVSKWHTPKPEPIFEWTPEIRPLNGDWEELDKRVSRHVALNLRNTECAWEPRPSSFREKILKEYPDKPAELMTILGKLRKS